MGLSEAGGERWGSTWRDEVGAEVWRGFLEGARATKYDVRKSVEFESNKPLRLYTGKQLENNGTESCSYLRLPQPFSMFSSPNFPHESVS
jgi:hypothetical protein